MNKYEVAKRVANKLAQEKKIKSANERRVHNIGKTDKGAPQIFWNYIRAHGSPSKNSQTVIKDEDAKIFEGDDALWYFTDVIRHKFGTKETAVQTQTGPATTEKCERSKFGIETIIG